MKYDAKKNKIEKDVKKIWKTKVWEKNLKKNADIKF